MVERLYSRHLPLHVHITTLFVLLAVVLSAVLSIYNYRQSSALLLNASDDLFQQVSAQIELEFQRSYEPISQAANLIAHTPITEVETLSERLQHMPLLVAALKERPQMTALAISYDNGDYFIVRVLNDTHMRLTFDAPENAYYQIDNIITSADGTRHIERVFCDRNLVQIARFNAGSTDYDPRVRPWYLAAQKNPDAAVTDPYLYFFIRKVGITFSRRNAAGNAVIAADIALDMLSASVRKLSLHPGTQLVLLDNQDQVLAYNHQAELIQQASDQSVHIARLNELPAPALQQIGDLQALPEGNFDIELDNVEWRGTLRTLSPAPGVSFRLLTLIPRDQLLLGAREIRDISALITAALSLLSLPLIWLIAHRIALPLRRLADDAAQIQQFQLDRHVARRSVVKEVDELAITMSLMQSTLAKFMRIIRQISAEEDFEKLLPLITRETLHSTGARGVILYLISEDEKQLTPEQFSFREAGLPDPETVVLQPGCPLTHCLQTGEVELRALQHCATESLRSLQSINDGNGQLVSIPLRTRREEPLGVLCMLTDSDSHNRESLAMVTAMADFASMTLESRQHETHQRALMKSFIELIASAIDAKSPYTAGHCQRVPELTTALVQAACDSDEAPFRGFQLDRQQWEALHLASWMHDCGKVTTPEYVVDKATKLETLYDRIHEVRMRFEVLKRDADISYWQGVAEGADPTVLAQTRDNLKQQLDEEFAFVAQCNVGSEFMGAERQAELARIGARTWLRTLDDRLGVGIEEKLRKTTRPAAPLPVVEPLLADKSDHLIPFSNTPDPQHARFNLKPGRYRFNRGELYNLSIQRGTLNEEERYIINDHIVQTIVMLEQLPYPKHLRDVPRLAGEHHEKIDGSGYPLGLTGAQMPLSSRAMAIADIFEALTAADRPYKRPKSLSEAIRIMSFMRNDQHIDSDLFELFLRSGIYREYGEQFLAPEQLDEVDIEQYLQKKSAAEVPA